MSSSPIPPARYGLPGLYATRALPDTPSERHLGSMFTAVVASLDTPTRRALAHVVQHCHTRRANFDPRRDPVLFFAEPDSVTSRIARDHLPSLEHHVSHDMDDVDRQRQHMEMQKEGFKEICLVSRLDEDERSVYVTERFGQNRRLCSELGFRYLKHLERPDLPLEQTMRPLPEVDYDYTRHVIAANDSGEDWTDDDDESLTDEDSACSHMSEITYESDALAMMRGAGQDGRTPAAEDSD